MMKTLNCLVSEHGSLLFVAIAGSEFLWKTAEDSTDK